MDLVSIIVPIYNVEPFLLDCLVSISSQTYEYIEVLLIDDGSTDNSSSIAQSFSSMNNRFKYFKKSNGGLSSARNYGIEKASGTWVMFIDSDDLVSPFFVEHMLKLVEETKTELGICCYERFKDIREINEKNCSLLGSFSIGLTSDLYKTIDTPIMMLAWNKIYKRNLFNEIRYPEGKIHEDLGTTYKIFDELIQYAVLDEKLYYYRINHHSISLSKISIQKLDVIDFYFEQLLYYKKKYEISKKYKYFYKYSSLRVFKIFGTLLSYDKDRYIDYHLFKKGVESSYQQKFKTILKSKIGFVRRFIMMLSCKKVFLLMLLSKIKHWIKK